MRDKTLLLRMILALAAYMISSALLYDTMARFKFFHLAPGQSIKIFIIINVVSLFLIAIARKKFLVVLDIICMFFIGTHIIVHSKIVKGSFEINSDIYFPPSISALIVLSVIILLLLAGWLNRFEKGLNKMFSNGAQKEDIVLIRSNNIKIFLMFCIILLPVAYALAVLSFIAPLVKFSKYLSILMAVVGIMTIVGCVIFLYRGWIRNKDKV